ncbi:uncharacterized protein LOC131614550 [Vicia villosa]|uniref:uncharacterized protein LOC131614550 n=1 Tax=Vicia villosa TaxID=3911 RepID=UPI00273C4AC3|nr:uncharacterized protein LOC131614550 [Vicia villosa]
MGLTTNTEAEWFHNVVTETGLGGLCCTGYVTISHDMQGVFSKRWHKEMSSFHFPVGELTITLHDVACLLHLHIKGRLLNHFWIQIVAAIEWMVDYLGMDPFPVDYECRTMNGAHVRFPPLKELYEHHLVAAAGTEDEGDAIFVEYHRGWALRSWFMLLGTAILSWIISYFHRIHGYDPDLLYTDDMHRAARYVFQLGNHKVASYWVYLNFTAHDDIKYMPFGDYRDVVLFDRISLYFGWLACGTNTMVRYMSEWCLRHFRHVQMIPRSPSEVAPDTITRRALTDIFQDMEHHLVPEEYRGMRASQSWHCVDGHVTWFFKVSHHIMTSDALGRPPRPPYEGLLKNQ